ncbi:MAG: MFS transporter [Clostridia bacterium]
MTKKAGCGGTLFTRNFILTCFSTLLFYVSFHVLLPTLPMYVLGLGGTEGDVGLVMSAFAMASVFMRPFAGRWVDRGGKKGLMLAGAAVYVASATLYGVVTHVKGLVAVRFLHGLGIGMYSTAASSLISESVPRHRRGEGLGYFLLATSLAMAVGPVVGVGIAERMSYSALFTASGILAGIVVICTLFITVPSVERARSPFSSVGRRQSKQSKSVGDIAGSSGPGSSRTSWYRRALAGVASFLGLEALFPSITLGFGSATYGSIASFIAVYAGSRGVNNPGVFFTVFALSMFTTRTFAGKISDRYGRASVIAPGLAAISLGMATLASSRSLVSFALAAVIYGVGFSVMQPTVTALTVDHVPAGRRGAALGTLMAMYDVGVALGGVAAGWIAERFPLDAVYWCMSGVGACGLVFFICGYRRYCAMRQSAMAAQLALVSEAGSAGRIGVPLE